MPAPSWGGHFFFGWQNGTLYACNVQVGHNPRECAPPATAAAGFPRSGGVGHVRTNSEKKRGSPMGSVIKKRRKRMSKKKHRKMLRRTRVQRRKLGK